MAKIYSNNRSLLVLIFLIILAFIAYLLFDHSLFTEGVYKNYSSPSALDFFFTFIQLYGYWLFFFYCVLIAFVLFLENTNPDRTLAWLLVISVIPVVGIILYWIVGPNFRYFANKRRFKLSRKPIHIKSLNVDLPSSLDKDTYMTVFSSSGEQLHTNCSIDIYKDGLEAFPQIFSCIENAKKSILIESYIVRDDDFGNELKKILCKKAAEGINVCLMYDAVGSWSIGRKFVKDLKKHGVHAIPFLPVSFPMFRGANYRNHRKIMIIDNKTAFMGGLNIGSEYVCKNPKFGYWRDTHIKIKGSAVNSLIKIFNTDLMSSNANKLTKKIFLSNQEEAFDNSGNSNMQIVASGPDTAWDTVQKAYLSLISRSRKKVWITTPYLIPGEALQDALCMAALSGVDVRILIPKKSDSTIVSWATMHSCTILLQAGVRIFLYPEDRFVHAKTFVCDHSIFSVGSANVDTRSLEINFEVQSIIYDTNANKIGTALYEEDLLISKEIIFENWKNRPLTEKIKENIGKLFSSLV